MSKLRAPGNGTSTSSSPDYSDCPLSTEQPELNGQQRPDDLPPGMARCAACQQPFPTFDSPPPRCCVSCDEHIRKLIRRRALTAERVAAWRARQAALQQGAKRRKQQNAQRQQRLRVRRNASAGRNAPGPAHYGVGGEAWAWLGQPLRPRREVEASRLPPAPPGLFNGRVTARAGHQRQPEVRYCEREGCDRPLNLGWHKTKGTVCRKCRDAEAAAARQIRQQAQEFGTPEEIQRQLGETMSVEELDRLLDEQEQG